MDPQEVRVLVQIGEEVLPLAKAAIGAVTAFAREHGGNAETIAQLEANRQTIDQDAQTIDGELKADAGQDPPAAT